MARFETAMLKYKNRILCYWTNVQPSFSETDITGTYWYIHD